MNAGTRPIIDRNVSIEAPRPKTKGASMASHAQKISAALFASVLIGSGVFILLVSTAPSAGWAELDPIIINGNSGFTEGEGVVNGTGSSEWPYIISGWEISNFAWDGISIMHTTAYFVIRDVHVNSTSEGTGLAHAIYLEDVSNGTIESSLINSTVKGIYMTGCDNITISDVEILECSDWAVYSMQSQDIDVVDSSIGGTKGVHAQDGSRLDVLRCDVEGVVYGVDFSNVDNSTVLSSSFLDCDYGVNLGTADRCNVSGNAVQNCVRGIWLVYIYNSDIGGNAVSYIDSIGIWVYDGSYNNTVRSNLVANCSDGGILMEWSVHDCVVWNNTIVNNTSSWTAGGLALWNCEDILVYHNVFTDNTPAHAYDHSVADNRWNESYPTGGNYWDDYSGVDDKNGAGQDLEGPDGIGDAAHCFDGDTSDCYPLMAAPTSNTAPVASFSVDPVTADAGVEFSFDASGSSDAEDPVEDLQVRWDWDGDGNWDTGYSTDKTATHVYSIPDTYTVKMEVMDTGGLTDITTETVVVTGTPIPEFSSLVVPVLAVMALFLVARRRRAG